MRAWSSPVHRVHLGSGPQRGRGHRHRDAEAVSGRFHRTPEHAFEFLNGTDDSWRDGENTDPDKLGNFTDPTRITAPTGLGPGDNEISVSAGQVPVWIIGIFDPDAGVQVRNLLPEGRY